MGQAAAVLLVKARFFLFMAVISIFFDSHMSYQYVLSKSGMGEFESIIFSLILASLCSFFGAIVFTPFSMRLIAGKSAELARIQNPVAKVCVLIGSIICFFLLLIILCVAYVIDLQSTYQGLGEGDRIFKYLLTFLIVVGSDVLFVCHNVTRFMMKNSIKLEELEELDIKKMGIEQAQARRPGRNFE